MHLFSLIYPWLANSGLCSLENPMLQVKSHCFSIHSVLYPEIWSGGPHDAINCEQSLLQFSFV